jgi:hypothetical protein
VYFRGLAWNFTAEVTAILVVIVIVGINAQRQTILMWQAVLVYSSHVTSSYCAFLAEDDYQYGCPIGWCIVPRRISIGMVLRKYSWLELTHLYPILWLCQSHAFIAT